MHAPGLPLLLAPLAAVSDNHRWMRYEMVLLAALAAALLMALLERVPLPLGWQRWAAWAAVVGSAPFVVYSGQLYPEIPAAAAVLGTTLLLVRPRPGSAALVGAAVLAAALPWLNVRFLPLTMAIALAALWRAWHSARRPAAMVAVVVPLAISGLVLALAFQHWYGSWLPTAQYALSDSPRSVPGFYRGLVSDLLDPRSGWLPVAPLDIAGLITIGAAVVRLGRPVAIAALAAGLYLLIIAASGLGFVGSSFPGRQLVVVLPLVAIPIAVMLSRQQRLTVAVFALLALLSVVLTARAVHEHARWPPGPPGSAMARYDAVWPNSALGLPVPVTWTGRAGGTTPLFPASAYTAAVPLRAKAPATGTVARIVVRDGLGDVLAARDVDARALPPEISWRTFSLPFHSGSATRMTLSVRTIGSADVKAGPAAIVSAPDQTVAGVTGYPDLWLTVAWLGGMALAGIALTLHTVRQPRRTSSV